MFRRTWLVLALVVLAVPGPAPPSPVSYALPLTGPARVARGFSPPTSRYGAGHRGVDLAAPPGSVVSSAAAGVVDFAGVLVNRGVVSVRHADGIRTTYEPMATIEVVRGEVVSAGSRLGTLARGHPGCPVTACLHWGALVGGSYVDPMSLLAPVDIVLLPPVAD